MVSNTSLAFKPPGALKTFSEKKQVKYLFTQLTQWLWRACELALASVFYSRKAADIWMCAR